MARPYSRCYWKFWLAQFLWKPRVVFKSAEQILDAHFKLWLLRIFYSYSDPPSFYCVGKSCFFHSAFQRDQVKVHVDKIVVVPKQNTHAYMYLSHLTIVLPFLSLTLFLNPKTKIHTWQVCMNVNIRWSGGEKKKHNSTNTK